jgi:hypothetical protein
MFAPHLAGVGGRPPVQLLVPTLDLLDPRRLHLCIIIQARDQALGEPCTVSGRELQQLLFDGQGEIGGRMAWMNVP